MKNIFYIFLLIPLIACITFAQMQEKEIPDSLISPVTLTGEQDHARLMKLLNIDSLRAGPSWKPTDPNAANTDESKANPYPNLPDPLKLNNGKEVTSPEMWWEKRRPEIKEYFDREIYGRVPENIPEVNWEILSTTDDTLKNIAVITKKLSGHVDNSSYPLISVDIALTLVLPAKAKGPVPVIIEFGFKFPANFKMTDQMKKIIDSMAVWQPIILSKGWGGAMLF